MARFQWDYLRFYEGKLYLANSTTEATKRILFVPTCNMVFNSKADAENFLREDDLRATVR